MTEVCLHCIVMALLTSCAACPIAAGISPGDGGSNSTFPYLTKVAHRGITNAAKIESKFKEKI